MRKILCAFGLALCSLGVTAGDIYVDKNGSVADALKYFAGVQMNSCFIYK